MNVDAHATKMKQFIESLPPTSVQVVFFNDRDNLPCTKEIVRRYVVGGQTFYINSGPVGKWVYTYRLDDIKYLFTCIDTNVQAFVGHVHTRAPLEGGAIFDMANIGNHLTTGISVFGNKRWITSHLTRYIEDPVQPMEFVIDHSMECTLDLDTPITTTSLCFTKRRVLTNQTLVNLCHQEQPTCWFDVIQSLHRVFTNPNPPQQGGNVANKASVTYQGKAYKLHAGSRGGLYIIRKNKKVYWKGQKGGASGPILTDEIIAMINTHIVQHVVQYYKRMQISHQHIQTTLLYDQDNEFQSNKSYMILVYAIPEHFMCRRFYLETSKVFAAYEAMVGRQVSHFHKSCLQEFQAMAHVHTQSLVNLIG